MIILNNFLLSLQFLTIINIKDNITIYEDRLGKAVIFFPVVGVLIGLILIITLRSLSLWLPIALTDAFILIALLIITGGLHIDGFADTVDGFAGGKNKDDILRIMKDSRIGTFGVVGIVMLLLTKYLSIYSLQEDTKYLVLITMPVIGRWSVLPMGLFFKYARIEGGTGKIFAESIRLKEFIIGTIMALAIIIPLFRLKGFLMFAVIFIITLLIGRYSKRKINGITGDVFGATIEINELIILILSLLV